MTESDSDSLRAALFPKGSDSLSDEQRRILWEQYRLFIETSEKLVARRQTVNAFFLSINTLTLSAVAFIVGILIEEEIRLSNGITATIPMVAGILFCAAWITLVKSYKQLNHGKFQVIHLLEEHLPASIFKAEWLALGEGKNPQKYIAFTRTERYIPWVFLISYILVLVVNFAGPLCVAVANAQ